MDRSVGVGGENCNTIEHIDPLGRKTGYEYDIYNRLTAQVDANGNRAEIDYHPDDYWINHHPIAIRSADGAHYQLTYDERGNLSEFIAPTGNHLRYLRDEKGQLLRVLDKLGVLQTLQWNHRGELISESNASDAKTRYHYDALGRISDIDTEGEGRTTYHLIVF